MYRHLGLQRIPRATGQPEPRERATRRATSAIGFGAAIGLATSTVAIGAATLTAVPETVTVPLAMVLGFGVIVSALIVAVER